MSSVATGLPAQAQPARAGESARVGHTPPSERVQSIDVLRGFDMFWILGVEDFFHALAIATGWSGVVLASRELSHSAWQGCTCYDLIQPLFLFIVGLTLPIAIGRRLARGQTKGEVFRRLFGRALILIVLGHFDKNGPLSFDFAHIRYTGVLERIGVSGLAVGVILMHFKPRGQIAWLAGLLLFYWALLSFVTAPGQPVHTYAEGRNIIDWLDQRIMPGRLVSGDTDANGWTATPNCFSTVLFGALAGQWILSDRRFWRKFLGMAAAGCLLVAFGWLWGRQLPIIKHLWTSSYVVFAAGWSCLLLAFFFAIIDGVKWRAWAFPFLIIGMNPLVIYILKDTNWVDFPYLSKFFLGFAWAGCTPHWAAVWHEAATVLVELLFLYVLYRKRWFWRV